MPHINDKPGAPAAGGVSLDPAQPTRDGRRSALAKLAGLLGFLGGLAAIFIAGGVIGTDRVREWVEPLGPFGPLLYVPLSAVLGTVFVPGAVLAAAAGLLFGPWVGAASALAAGTLAALLSRGLSGRLGSSSFDEIATGRVHALAELARRNGLVAVIVARLSPWVPDAPLNHAFGVVGLTALSVALGHLLAAGPRALAYATIGAHSDDPTGSASLLGWALNISTGVIGAALLVYVVVRHRRAHRQEDASVTGRVSGDTPAEATQE
ncbi:MAG: VTT domain-containing protein [Solirubrobacteraceae bacterium]|nr:VTT domain-containing protein [Solirubrobacteraceae bacterium]